MPDEVTREMAEQREEAKTTLTERIDAHCRLVAEAEDAVRSPVSQEGLRVGDITYLPPSFQVNTDPFFDPQTALDALRACKQEPALATWAMAWGVRLCMAMGAK
jgi:hypothetical protein